MCVFSSWYDLPGIIFLNFFRYVAKLAIGSKRGSKKEKGRSKTRKDVLKQKKDILKQEKLFPNRKSYHSIKWGMLVTETFYSKFAAL